MRDVSDVLKLPWKALSRQHEAATFGIWVFLASELLFFGSLLLLYTVYRSANPDGIHHCWPRDRYLVRDGQYRRSDDE